MAKVNSVILAGIQFVNKVRSEEKPQQNPIDRARAKMVEALKEQMEAAQCMLEKRPYEKRRPRKITNENGETETKEMRVRFKPWYWMDLDGSAYIQLKYGSQTLAKDGMALVARAGRLEDIPTTLNKIVAAVEKGEFDAVLLAAAQKAGQRMRKDK